jgi:hypothetical protein
MLAGFECQGISKLNDSSASHYQFLHDPSLLGVQDLGAGASIAAAFEETGGAAAHPLMLTIGSALMPNPVVLEEYCIACCFTETGL